MFIILNLKFEYIKIKVKKKGLLNLKKSYIYILIDFLVMGVVLLSFVGFEVYVGKLCGFEDVFENCIMVMFMCMELLEICIFVRVNKLFYRVLRFDMVWEYMFFFNYKFLV